MCTQSPKGERAGAAGTLQARPSFEWTALCLPARSETLGPGLEAERDRPKASIVAHMARSIAAPAGRSGSGDGRLGLVTWATRAGLLQPAWQLWLSFEREAASAVCATQAATLSLAVIVYLLLDCMSREQPSSSNSRRRFLL